MSIKKTIKKLAEKIFQSNWYPNKKILLESVPDMSCQTYPVFQEMLKRGMNDEYKLIWLVTEKNAFKDVKIKNVKFKNYQPKNVFERIDRWYLLLTSRAMLYANRYIGKIFDKQLFIYLKHGTSLKSRLMHCNPDEKNESDYCIALSELFIQYDVLELGGLEENQLIITGYPRNDYLYEKKDFISLVYPDNSYSKVILWMPTFRKFDNSNRIDSHFDFPMEIPCLYSKEDCIKLDDELRERNMLLILKPHPGQKLTSIKKLGLSNFVTLYNEELDSKGIQLYQFIGSTDALITDYSSVYYDYLLTEKMIGLTVDDFEDYKKDTGFVFDNVFDYVIGEHIVDCDSFITFIKNVYTGNDTLKEERKKANELENAYHDNRSSERVCDFIFQELNKRYK